MARFAAAAFESHVSALLHGLEQRGKEGENYPFSGLPPSRGPWFHSGFRFDFVKASTEALRAPVKENGSRGAADELIPDR